MLPKQGNMAAWSELVSELAQVGANPDVQAFAANPNVTGDRLVDATLASLVKSPMTA